MWFAVRWKLLPNYFYSIEEKHAMKIPVSIHLYYRLMKKYCGHHFFPFLLLLCVCVFTVIDLKGVLAKNYRNTLVSLHSKLTQTIANNCFLLYGDDKCMQCVPYYMYMQSFTLTWSLFPEPTEARLFLSTLLAMLLYPNHFLFFLIVVFLKLGFLKLGLALSCTWLSWWCLFPAVRKGFPNCKKGNSLQKRLRFLKIS